jgi:hypothetical protein
VLSPVTIIRFFRIVVIAAAFFVAFRASQTATAARNAGETIPGIEFAVAALSVFFLIGAFVTERTQGEEMNTRKDLLWGLGGGGVAIVVGRLLS